MLSNSESDMTIKPFLLIMPALVACSSGPKAEGEALAKDYCAALKNAASDPAKAMTLGAKFAEKSQKAASKYVSEPTKMNELLQGYMDGASKCSL